MRRYLHWKTYLVLFALTIVAVALYHFNRLAQDMAAEEKKRVQIIVDGIEAITLAAATTSNNDITFASKIVTENETIPLIIADIEGNILSHTNIDSARIARDPSYLDSRLQDFKKVHKPLLIDYQYGRNLVYYGESKLLEQIKYYPVYLIAITFLFLVIVLVALSNAQRSIQNQVWVGMSKETAHQLGTPLSSIVGWMEILKEDDKNKEAVAEMEKDVSRLQLIADRFSKIGSKPQLEEEDLIPRLEDMVVYMRKRAPSKISIDFDYESEDKEVKALLSGPLFDWVIENLLRNALDAMAGEGKIGIYLKNQARLITIDISDTGKGVPHSDFKKIFMPGFSTKKRGWGLGLSLAKRIIEKYHNGSIFVRHSEPGVRTTFRILLRR